MPADLFDSPPLDAIFKSKTYEQFKQGLAESHCPKCPQLCVGRTTIVVDRGNPASKLVVIGEGPGEKEDRQGKAFVGRAGQLLDKIMASIDLDTNKDMLILNVVKCRPPDNRPPTPFEAAQCLPYLEWQLAFVKPRVVVLLGATAAKYFLADTQGKGMKGRVGQFFESEKYPGITFQLQYHPAYLLRDPRKKTETWEHTKALKKCLEAIPSSNEAVGGS